MATEITTPTRTANWYIDNNNYLVINILEGTSLTVPTGDPAVAVLTYVKVPDTLHEYTDEPVIDKRWHDAICAKAISIIALKSKVTKVDRNGGQYQTVGDLSTHQFWKSIFDKAVIEGKKIANQQKQDRPITVPTNYF